MHFLHLDGACTDRRSAMGTMVRVQIAAAQWGRWCVYRSLQHNGHNGAVYGTCAEAERIVPMHRALETVTPPPTSPA
ncbi:hypothetical protein ACFQ3W_03720 [Paenibacillus puldeungensis]|uniref:Uncharacterized protein n=1 Tax=Paenibacillus puldeungensis TaxID=696536 RepID=A0ABW3RT50_9BACL